MSNIEHESVVGGQIARALGPTGQAPNEAQVDTGRARLSEGDRMNARGKNFKNTVTRTHAMAMAVNTLTEPGLLKPPVAVSIIGHGTFGKVRIAKHFWERTA